MLIGGEGAAAAAFSAPRFGWFWCTGCVGHKPQPVRKIHSTESNIAVSKEPGLDFTSSLLYYDERARETAEENLYGLIISAKAALSVDICVRESEREEAGRRPAFAPFPLLRERVCAGANLKGVQLLAGPLSARHCKHTHAPDVFTARPSLHQTHAG